ncbi:MAG TPA: DUF4097 family beta strand repeat-containing protein [Vicinamibacterales bacterium]|nr:DUF4097 family beta strand repeat-containing protein [Vicinamibacterales bacterium]
MTRFIAAAALIAGFVAAPAQAGAQEKETERVDRTIPFAPGGTLKLKNFSGDIRITGTSEGQVVIAAVRRATRERLDAIKLDIQAGDREIAIDANRRESVWKNRNDNVVETEFDIRVPADTRLDIDAFSSPIQVTGVTGRQKVKTFSGEITVRGAAASLDLHSFSGRVDLQLVDTTAAPELQVETFSGDIVAEMPEASSGNVRFNSFSGGLKSDLPLTLESGDQRNLRARLNNGGAEMRFKTFSGDVRLTRN